MSALAHKRHKPSLNLIYLGVLSAAAQPISILDLIYEFL